MPLREFINRHCDGNVRAARSCAGSGRRKHSREGSAESSRLEAVIASIVERRSIMREVAIARKMNPQLQSNSDIKHHCEAPKGSRHECDRHGAGGERWNDDGGKRDADTKTSDAYRTVAAQLYGGAYPNFLTTPCSRNAHSVLQ
jgi:hypothetical protein